MSHILACEAFGRTRRTSSSGATRRSRNCGTCLPITTSLLCSADRAPESLRWSVQVSFPSSTARRRFLSARAHGTWSSFARSSIRSTSCSTRSSTRSSCRPLQSRRWLGCRDFQRRTWPRPRQGARAPDQRSKCRFNLECEPDASNENIQWQCRTRLRDVLFEGDVIDVGALFDFVEERLRMLDEALSDGATSGAPNLLLLIDQFEEVFKPKVDPAGGKMIMSLITSIHTYRPFNLFLIITMRSEELHRCSEFLGVTEVVNSSMYLVDLIGGRDIEQAIVEPARRVLKIVGPRSGRRRNGTIYAAGAEPVTSGVRRRARSAGASGGSTALDAASVAFGLGQGDRALGSKGRTRQRFKSTWRISKRCRVGTARRDR